MKSRRLRILCGGLVVLAGVGLLKLSGPRSEQQLVVAPTSEYSVRADPSVTESTVPGAAGLRLASVPGFARWESRTPAAADAEHMNIPPQALRQLRQLVPGQRFELKLLGHAYPEVRVEQVQRWPNGTLAITADLSTAPYSRAFIAITGDRLLAHVRDFASGKEFQIHPAREAGAYLAIEIDPQASDQPPCLACGGHHGPSGHTFHHPAIGMEADQPSGEPIDWNTPLPQSGDALPQSGWAPSSTGTIPLDLVILDLMVVYSPAARVAAGGEADILNRISLAVQIGNDVLANSDTRTQIQLVHTAEVAFVEESPENADSAVRYLEALTQGTGVFADVHGLRNSHAADFVSLLVDTQSTVGISNRPVNFLSPDQAFSVCQVQNVHNHYTLIHEIAHNMGVGHSKSQPVASYISTAFFPYAAGWQWADDLSYNGFTPGTVGFCTVMTYEVWNDSGILNYRRVPFFSNPDKTFNGNPVGDPADGNAARVIRMGRFEFSGYRGPRQNPAPLAQFPAVIDFEDYLSFFYQGPADDIDWTHHSGPTDTDGTGPAAAADGNYYFYVEASNQFKKSADLQIDMDLTGMVSAVLEFRYHMWEDVTTNQMGNLMVEASVDGGSTWLFPELWFADGSQGDAWLTAQVDLSPLAGQLLCLRFRAETMSGNRSDIALDSILITAEGPPVGYDAFMLANYPGLSDLRPEGDPDSDKVSNFIEYALGMNPGVPDRHLYPSSHYDLGGNMMSLSFRRARGTVRYRVLVATDLSSWDSAEVFWDTALGPPGLVAVGEVQTVEIPLPSTGVKFFRLWVSE